MRFSVKIKGSRFLRMLVSDISNGQNGQLNCMKSNLSCKVVFCPVLRAIGRCSVLWILFSPNAYTASVTLTFGSYQQCIRCHVLVLPWKKFVQGKALFGKDMCASIGENEVKTLSSLPEVGYIGP